MTGCRWRCAFVAVAVSALALAACTQGGSSDVSRTAGREPSVGARDPSFVPPRLSSGVLAIAALPDGRYLIGGYFREVGGDSATNYLARLNSDGSRDTSFTPLPLDSRVPVIAALPDGKYLIGGAFGQADDDPSLDKVMRVNPDGSRDSSFRPPSLNGSVWAVGALPGGKYLIGGAFTNAGGRQAFDRVARLNPDGSLDTSFVPPSLDAAVLAIARAADGKYLVGGDFKEAGGDWYTNYLARLNSDGSLDSHFPAPRLNGSVNSIQRDSDGKYIVGGIFTEEVGGYGDWSLSKVARLDADGRRDRSFKPPTFNESVTSVIPVSGGKYVAVGPFTAVNGNRAMNHVARLNADGTLDTTFVPLYLNAAVESVGVGPDGRYVIGGGFTNAGGHDSLNFVARLLS